MLSKSGAGVLKTGRHSATILLNAAEHFSPVNMVAQDQTMQFRSRDCLAIDVDCGR